MANDDIEKMTIKASVLGWKDGEWPESFEQEGMTYERRHSTKAASGEVQCAEYQNEEDEWLIVYGE
jgi:hypothetical protein